MSYTVAPNQNPVANHGPNQTAKHSGDTITLDGSATTDPDGPPLQPLTYTWTQTGGVPVTLSDSHAVKPTFVVPPAPSPYTYPHNITFSLNVTDPYGGTSTTADSVNIQVVATQPTITGITKTRPPGGTTFFTGDLLTLVPAITTRTRLRLTYTWAQISGRTTSLSSLSAANPTYTLPSSGAAPTTAACTSGTTATGPAVANCPRWSLTVSPRTAPPSPPQPKCAAYGSSLPTRPVANAGAAKPRYEARGPDRDPRRFGLDASERPHHQLRVEPDRRPRSFALEQHCAEADVHASGRWRHVDRLHVLVDGRRHPKPDHGYRHQRQHVDRRDHHHGDAGPEPRGRQPRSGPDRKGRRQRHHPRRVGVDQPTLQPLNYTWTQVNNGRAEHHALQRQRPEADVHRTPRSRGGRLRRAVQRQRAKQRQPR